jgi:hypothetical protein
LDRCHARRLPLVASWSLRQPACRSPTGVGTTIWIDEPGRLKERLTSVDAKDTTAVCFPIGPSRPSDAVQGSGFPGIDSVLYTVTVARRRPRIWSTTNSATKTLTVARAHMPSVDIDSGNATMTVAAPTTHATSAPIT